MNFRREIEKKFVVSDYGSVGLLLKHVQAMFPTAEVDGGRSIDMFWKQDNADFIRLRKNTLELTIKRTDRGSIVDRVEENLLVDSYDDAYVWATAVFGRPVGAIEKTYTIFFLPTFNVSVYTVAGSGTLFLEVEAPSLDTVNRISSQLSDVIEMEQEHRSLFQIFFGGHN